MKNFRFMNLRVYQDAKLFHRKIIYFTKNWPKEFEYLKIQLRRAALSVVLNIAEGAGKYSDKDFNRYIKNSLGSINESAACIDIALDEKLFDDKIAHELLSEASRLKDSLGSLSKKLKS
jgi:four helix bundle protein